MKYCFSTLGCPEFTFNDIYAAAIDLGYSAIEIRGIGKEMYAPNIKEFTGAELLKTTDKLSLAKLSIAVFASGAYIYDKSMEKAALKEAFDYIDLASKTKVKYVRVLADKDAGPQEYKPDIDYAAKNLKAICKYAKDKNVDILIETNGIFAKSATMLDLLKKVDASNLFIIWDIHHTVRFFSETPDYTCDKLKNYIKHVHIKDSIVKDGKIIYRMTGSGTMPLKDSLAALKNINYNGYISLEWVKRWAPNLEESSVVFPQFISYMKQLETTI